MRCKFYEILSFTVIILAYLEHGQQERAHSVDSSLLSTAKFYIASEQTF